MIYYFSGTGNSEWVAKEIAKGLGLKAVSIVEVTTSVVVSKDEPTGFVCPTYAWAPVKIMLEFLKKVTWEPEAYTFIVNTCESEAGTKMKKLKKRYGFSSCYSIDMPNNYIILSKPDSEEEVRKKVLEAMKEIETICKEVNQREVHYRVKKGTLGGIKSVVVAPMFMKFFTSTKPFYVEDTCISCGLCETKCPTKTIRLIDGKPVWNGKCLMCLKCINQCPTEAIQYGKRSKNNGRYYFNEKYTK